MRKKKQNERGAEQRRKTARRKRVRKKAATKGNKRRLKEGRQMDEWKEVIQREKEQYKGRKKGVRNRILPMKNQRKKDLEKDDLINKL